MDNMDCVKCKLCNAPIYRSWRYQCVNCQCPNYCHRSYATSLGINKLSNFSWIQNILTESHNQLNDYKIAMSLAESNNLVWLPIGLQSKEIADFKKLWSDSCTLYSLEMTKPNEDAREMLISKQIPMVDWNLEANKNLKNDEFISKICDTFKRNRDSNHFGFGEIELVDSNDTCTNCKTTFLEKDKYCIRITHSAEYGSHLSCFKCHTCKEILSDFHYCYDNKSGNVYCLRHFGDINYSRCFGCDELIFNKDYTKAMDHEFHEDHFACTECDRSLSGDKYILKNESPFCLKCFNDKFGNSCDRCHEKISCDSKDLSFDNRHWHDECFYCEVCQKSLVDKSFASRDGNIYCSDCFDNKFSSRCSGCGDIFKSGIRKYDYEGEEWHEQCFLCAECNESIGGKSFIPKNGNLICITCYESKYAQRCSKCSEIIRKGGVTYKGDPWHRECFLCTHCDKPLSNIKFTSKDEKPYCADCFAELFAKRCKKCSKPISGFGGCKFISLDEVNWHTECFTCSKCQTSLVGKGFLTHQEEIMCVICGQITSDQAE